MKPSERRALRRRDEIGKNSGYESTYQDTQINSNFKKSSAVSERKEGFFQSHVRLITFLICMAVFLLVFGPWNIYHISKAISDMEKKVDNKRDMSMETVYALSELGEELSWMHFETYNYTDLSYDTDDGKYIKREYCVKDTGYIIWAGGIKGQSRPEYVYLIDIGNTGDVLDMRKENIKKYVKKINSQEKTVKYE